MAKVLDIPEDNQGWEDLIVKGKTAPSTVTQPDTDTVEETGTVEVAVTSPEMGTNTATAENTVTVTLPSLKPTDAMFRMIGYFTQTQKDYIKKKAKKYKVTEAQVMRYAMDELIKSGKL